MQQLVTTPAQAGEILARRRKSKKISQKELANKLGISQGRLSVLESDPKGLTLERLIGLVNLLGLEVLIREKTSPAKTPW